MQISPSGLFGLSAFPHLSLSLTIEFRDKNSD